MCEPVTLLIKTDCSKFLPELQIFPDQYQVPQIHLPFKPVLHRINMASILTLYVYFNLPCAHCFWVQDLTRLAAEMAFEWCAILYLLSSYLHAD